MTDAELRKHFDLKPCPNPRHEFQVGKLFGEWVWAADCWASLVDGRLKSYALSAHSLKSESGQKAYVLIIWRLKIIWGWI